MEASAIHAGAGLGRGRVKLAAPLLRLRSDQQLVGLFRGGNEEAFRVIHDRYRARLLAYLRQMLAGPHPDAEDVLQDVFVRAYAGLSANGRELSLRPWLYRIAHNRCVDELRRPMPPAPEALELAPAATTDPAVESEQRESLRRLIADIRRLPDQQRSALLMREMSGMAYTEIGGALALSVPAVKSLLVRARISLAAASEARDTACHEIRTELAEAHDRGVRPSGLARRHLHDCIGCREYRAEMRGVSHQLAALTPALGPLGIVARLIGAGGSAGGGAAAGGTGSGVLAVGGAAGAGSTALGAAATHVAAVVAAAVVTAGGAVEIQRTVATQLDPPPAHHAKRVATMHRATSAHGVVATLAAPVSPSLPAPVQQTLLSPAPAHRTRPNVPNQVQRTRRKHNAPTPTTATAAPAPAPAATDSSSTASGTASTTSTTAAVTPPSCQPATTAAPAPTTAPGPAASHGVPGTPAPCAQNTGTATSNPPASTAPAPTTAPTPSTAGTGAAGIGTSSTTTSGSSPSSATGGTQTQSS